MSKKRAEKTDLVLKNGGPVFKRDFLAPAKVNLFLKVLSRRPDGYHEISSLMQPISLYDEISIEIGGGSSIKISCSREDLPSGKDNLVFRAAELFFDKTGFRRAVSITLTKNTPVGAGLGGGSSDAATVLMGLNEMLGADLSEEELVGLGAGLGSDVPFFMMRSSAVASGRGERLRKVNLPPFDYVLINPGFPVSTPWAYNNLDLTKKHEDNILTYSDEAFMDPSRIKEFLVNDLEAVTLEKYPEITDLKKKLLDRGALGALMSGSGSTVFGVFSGQESALSAYESLKADLDESCLVFLARGLG